MRVYGPVRTFRCMHSPVSCGAEALSCPRQQCSRYIQYCTENPVPSIVRMYMYCPAPRSVEAFLCPRQICDAPIPSFFNYRETCFVLSLYSVCYPSYPSYSVHSLDKGLPCHSPFLRTFHNSASKKLFYNYSREIFIALFSKK
jgi:hypothetical protein